jgi:tetratricopeptide (TPR) repeat protein/tRNA A-37 threonylcarbamoyl transferase component Bud32
MMIGQTVSHYKIVEKLGGGGMGIVYKAEDTKLGRFVALKFLPDTVAQDRQAVERFLLEARAAAALSHPHICTIHEIDEHEGVPFIAMEYLEGKNLKFAIAGRPMPIEMVLELGLQITEALAAAHAKGITHRDIKPSNIFLTQGGQAKVVDFGLAKLAPQVTPASEDETIVADAPTQTADLTGSGTAMGTVAYMSPEQALGQDVDARSDLFSLGAVLYEMVTGRQSFTGSTQAAIFDKILNRTPPSPLRLGIEIPYELEQVLDKALEKNKLLRYQSALELHTDLRRIRRDIESGRSAAVPVVSGGVETAALGSGPTAAPPSGSTAVVIPTAEEALATSGSFAASLPIQGRNVGLWVVAALAIAALVIIGIMAVQRGREPALTGSDVLLLTDFLNTTDDPVFDGTLKQALAVKLEESPYLNLFPERQVQETLRFMGRAEDERVTRELGQEICERQGIKALVTGEIAPLGSSYVITLSALECRSGEVLARQQVQAASKEQVLAAVGSAAVEMRMDLGESLASVEKFDAPVEQATTSSLEALKAFSLAAEKRARGAEAEAIPLFKRAIELDPDFAMAYARLGTVLGNQGESKSALEYRKNAFALRGRVSEPERLYITAHYYGNATGEIDKQIETYELWQETYPADWTPSNNLSVLYNELGWYDKALEEAQRAVQLAPSQVFPYTNLQTAYLNLGRLEETKATFEEALSLGFSYWSLYADRYKVAYLEGDDATMRQQLEAVAGTPAEARLLELEAARFALTGQMTAARQLTQRAMEVAQQNNFQQLSASISASEALTEAFFENTEKALDQAGTALGIALNQETLSYTALTFGLVAPVGDAEALIDELAKEFPKDTKVNSVFLPNARAALAIGRGNYEEAVELLEAAIPYEQANLETLYLRGLALMLAGDGEAALDEFRKIHELESTAPLSPLQTLAYLGQARSHALVGDYAASRQAYEEFLTILQAADPDLPVLTAARSELEALPDSG